MNTSNTKDTTGRAFIVVGAESTGTRLATKILVENGLWGQYEHDQETDGLDPSVIEGKDLVVIRRSIPHAQEFVDLNEVLDYLVPRAVGVVVTFRTWDFALRSQDRRGHLLHGDESGMQRITRAYIEIFKFIENNRLPYVMFSFDGLIQDPKGQQEWLLNTLALEVKKFIKIKDTNEKYID